MSMVKLEGGIPMAATIEAIARVDIPVMAHIGLTPQSSTAWAATRCRGASTGTGRASTSACSTTPRAVQEAGAAAVVLEGMPRSLAGEITKSLAIPTIGIGAGPDCDGQVLVLHDVIGLSGAKLKFAKSYGDVGR